MKPFLSPLLALLALVVPGIAAEPGARPDPARFSNEIVAFSQANAETGGIVFTGSSSIRLWKSLKEDFSGLPVVNRGFGGACCNDLLTYFETVVARHEPKLLVAYSGSNDINEGISVRETFNDYTNFLTIAHERFPSMRIILNSVKIAPVRAAQIPKVKELNDLLIVWTQDKPWVRYLDSTSYLADPQGVPIGSYFGPDNLHMNASGYAKWKDLLDPVLREEWAKVNPTATPAPKAG